MRFSKILLSLLILITASSVNAQFTTDFGRAKIQSFDFDFAGGGARAAGMGKAYLAISDGVNGVSWNPAGIWEYDSPILGIGWGSNKPRGTTNSQETFFTFDGTNLQEFNQSSSNDHVGNFSSINSFNLIAPIRIKGHKFVSSISISRSFNQYSSYVSKTSFALPIGALLYNISGQFIILENDDSTNIATGIVSNETIGGMDIINFGFGTRFYDKISFGISANIYTGLIESITTSIDSLPGVSSFASFGQPAFHVASITDIDSIGFTSMNFNFGFKYNGDKLKLGLLLRAPLSLGVETEQTEISLFTVNGLEEESPPTLLTPKIKPPLTKYEFPLMIGFGSAYQVSENLLLAMDLEYRAYSKTNVKLRDSLQLDPSGNGSEFFTEMDADTVSALRWQDVMIFRIGAEYLKESKFGTIPIRAGFGYVPVPAGSIGITDTSPSVTPSYNFSFGSGLHWEQIKLDFSYTYTKRDFKTQPNNDLSNALIWSEFNYKNHQLSFTFTGFF